ncbi:protein kinase domain-containing protein [Microbispora sp. CA-135349]|uniref:protein kinase domain-containing protein n=1 Tax=Microbispora sp. CA-135349 TaxID=3239953 RepID=UPI003D8EEACC
MAHVIEADTTAEKPWLAIEYVAGPTLDAYVRGHGPLAADGLYGLAAGLAEAIVSIHAAGVVHRDLKPANVILSPDGPRVVDFGIARALDETAMTSTGVIVGSPGWISPEEYRGDDAGPLADVHNWGLLVAYAAPGAGGDRHPGRGPGGGRHGAAGPDLGPARRRHDALATGSIHHWPCSRFRPARSVGTGGHRCRCRRHRAADLRAPSPGRAPGAPGPWRYAHGACRGRSRPGRRHLAEPRGAAQSTAPGLRGG